MFEELFTKSKQSKSINPPRSSKSGFWIYVAKKEYAVPVSRLRPRRGNAQEVAGMLDRHRGKLHCASSGTQFDGCDSLAD